MRVSIKRIETDVVSGKYWEESDSTFREYDGQEKNLINVYDQVEYQEVIGFGGAFTQASSLNYFSLPADQRADLIDKYFDTEKGLGYNLCRGTINSCDFSDDFYSYDDVDGDMTLSHFSIAPDKATVIPMMKDAMMRSANLRIFSSPWSPPAWMKTNGKMDKGGSLREDCRDVWARYVAKYIRAYEDEGIHIWGVTVQNEPKAEQGWESCVYTAAMERDFVTGYLRPALYHEGVGDRKIFFWDHNKENLVDRALETLCNAGARDAFDGAAVHWYSGDHFGALSVFRDLYPEKILLSSEQCKGKTPGIPYDSGERYAHDMIGNLNHGANAWVDWNMLLDQDGGPDHWKDEQLATGWDPEKVWVGESPVMLDKSTGEFSFASSYYYIGHFSRYIPRGSRRIGCSCFSSKLEVAAFSTPTDRKVLVVMNATDKEESVTIRFDGGLADYSVKAHTISSYIF